MASGQDSQEKTEDATPKRLRDARKKGQVAKSRDLTTVFVMIIVFMTISIYAHSITSDLKELMHRTFTLIEKSSLTGSDLMTLGKMSLMTLIKVLAPILTAGLVSGTLIAFLQVGPMFTTEPLTPKMEKLNPIEGIKNMFKVVTFIELIKNILKLSLVMYLAYHTINHYLQEILLSSKVGLIDSVMITGKIIYSFFIKVALVFMVIALIDMAVQRWNFMKNMRMSKDEVKREYKQDEGDPHIKAERRRLHREMVFGDVKSNVKKSDAVVSNPTHVAVAVRYDRSEMAAPEITIKGQDQFAELILEAAREENIPIIRNIPLAWSLLKVEEGLPIPEDLYESVAEVLCFVYEMKEQAENKTSAMPTPSKKDFDPLS